jgi:acetyl-CoA carboxylase biotin carboxyl carrier protein
MTDSLDSINDELLASVCARAAQLAADQKVPPQLVRVHAGDISVEIAWPEVQQATALLAPRAPEPTGDPGELDLDTFSYVCAPTVGRFYHGPAPGAAPFVTVGDSVAEGQQIGILEAMKLMMPVTAETAGIVECFLTPNEAQVEYGERLVALVNHDNT